jgi:hypothetical protein
MVGNLSFHRAAYKFKENNDYTRLFNFQDLMAGTVHRISKIDRKNQYLFFSHIFKANQQLPP